MSNPRNPAQSPKYSAQIADRKQHYLRIFCDALKRSNIRFYVKPAPASLEGLPEELKIIILESQNTLASLQALVQSAPSYYNVYTIYSQRILATVIYNELGSANLLEYWYITEAKKIKRNGITWWREIQNFLISYEVDRILGATPLAFSGLLAMDLKDLVKIAEFQHNVSYLAEQFSRSALNSHPTTRGSEGHVSLSIIETHRLNRAIYRYELFCALFGSRKGEEWLRVWTLLADLDDLDFDAEMDTADEKVSSVFLTTFDPWEVEELACIQDFIFEFYEKSILKGLAHIIKFDMEEARWITRETKEFTWPRGMF